MATNLKTAYRLSVIIFTLLIFASAGGLYIPHLYRDNEVFTKVWMGNDVVSFAVVAPFLLFVLIRLKQQSFKAQLVWAGLLGYSFYNYAFYLLGTTFNSFFLIYVLLVALSLYALINVLTGIDIKSVGQKFRSTAPVKLISIFLFMIALFLGVFEISQAVRFVFTGRMPQVPPLILALDLVFIIPNMLLAAIWLWKRFNWGYILTIIMLVKGTTYGLVLITASAFVANFSIEGNWDPLLPFYIFVTAGSLLLLTILLRNMPAETESYQQPPQIIST